LLVALRDEGKCIIVVTHDVEFAARIADRVAILDDGRIASHGTPKSVLRQVTDFAPQIALAFPHTSWLTVEDALEDLSDQLSNSGFNTDMTA
jgi:energy-coupling factor transport system ATP-binding protein